MRETECTRCGASKLKMLWITGNVQNMKCQSCGFLISRIIDTQDARSTYGERLVSSGRRIR